MAEGDNIKNRLKMAEELAKMQNEMANAESRNFNLSNKILKANEEALIAKQQSKTIQDIYNDAIKKGVELSEEEKDLIKQANSEAAKRLKLSNKQLQVEKQRVGILTQIGNKLKQFEGSNFFGFLMETDAAIKGLNLELGLSGEKAEDMRQSIQGAAVNAARLGANTQDLANIQSTFADETGRANIQTKEALQSIVAIGKGTALGVDQAARLAGQFELMGLSAQQSADYVQGVVDSTERMGVNTLKVLKKISTNFKDLQKFTFRGGVKGFADMASYAEKFKIDMGSMLDSAERARTLEGAVDLAAQLQVMGGEFAKSDPFQLLFLSRNDPAKFTKKINEMTKGVATFKKQADGTMETFISPMDMDRLERVGQSLGMQRGELAEQSRRMLEISKMKQQMVGLDKEQMEIATGAAKREKDSLSYFVEIAGKRKMLNQLTNQDISSLKQQNKALEERAKNAKTFDEEFANTIQMFKSSLLPILEGINTVLENVVKPTVDTIQGFLSNLDSDLKSALKVGGTIVAGGLILTKALGMLTPFAGAIKNIGKGGISKGGVASAGGAAKGGFGAAAGAGAGIGLAAAGVGAGIGMAAAGFAKLADAMKDMPVEKMEEFKWIMLSLSTVLPLSALGVLAFGQAATTSAVGLLAFGGAVALVGAGIGIAAAGIGYMAEGMGELATKDKVDNLYGVAGGLSSIMAVTAGGGLANILGGGLANMVALTTSVSSMASNAEGMGKIGYAFEQIDTVLQGSSSQFKEIRATIDAINNMEAGNSSIFNNLASILSKPLRVEFAENNATFNATVNLNVDGKKIADSINVSRRVAIKTADEKSGKSGSGTV